MNPAKIAHLSWVLGPIGKNIAKAKAAMADYTQKQLKLSAPPAGANEVWFHNAQEELEKSADILASSLTEIEAALDIIQCVGGHMLAKELNTLASVALNNLSADDQEKCFLSIQEAMDVLPSFVGMVIDGAHDSAGVLLKYINDLRALRGVSALSDDSALPINLSFAYKSPPPYEADCDLDDRERVFQKASKDFCKLYSKAMKLRSQEQWIEMRQILKDLQRVTNDPELGSYWWVGEAIVDVIIADGLYLPPTINTALRVVMVATQRVNQGEMAAKENLNAGKFSALLNSLSISRKLTPTANEVIEHFDVKKNVEEDQIQHLQEMLEAQSVESINDVIPEIRTRLEAAMVSFGRAVGAKRMEGFQIQKKAFDQSVRTIANVFGIFNEHELSDTSFNLADMMMGAQAPADLTSEAIETVKDQILFLDARLTQLDRNPAAELLQIHDVTSDVVDVLAAESLRDLKKVCNLIATHIDSGGGDPAKLLEALTSLHDLANVLEFAGSTTIGMTLAAVVTQITNEVQGGKLAGSNQIGHAARALVCIEMFLQYINAGLQPPPNLLEKASEAVTAMGVTIQGVEPVTTSALLAKFEETADEEFDSDPLLSEIFELRPTLENATKRGTISSPAILSELATAALKLGSAATLKSEEQFSKLCRGVAELATDVPGRLESDAALEQSVESLLDRSVNLVLRCMDEYSSKGRINLFLVDTIEALFEFVGGSEENGLNSAPATTASSVEPVAEVDESKAARALPEGTDPILIGLFREEFAEQVSTLRACLDSHPANVTEQTCRAVHTLVGCSASAGCMPVHEVCGVLEERLYYMNANAQVLSQTQAEDLADLLTELEAFADEFPWTTESELLPAWIDAANLGQEPTNSTALDPVEAPHEYEAPEQESETVTLVTIKPNVSSASPAATEETDTVDLGYETDMVELFFMDADEGIPDLQQAVQEWLNNLSDNDLAVSIRRHMHTLKASAGLIQAHQIQGLTHNMESLFDSVTCGNIQADKACADLVEYVLNDIVSLTDCIRQNEPCPSNEELISFIQQCCENYSVDAEELARLTSQAPAIEQSSPGDAADTLAQITEGPAEDQAQASMPAEEVPHDSHEVEAIAPAPETDDKAEVEQTAEPPSVPAEEPRLKTRRGKRGLRGRAGSAKAGQPAPTATVETVVVDQQPTAEPAHAVPTLESMLDNQDVFEEAVDPSTYVLPEPALDPLARNGRDSDGAQAKRRRRAAKKIHADLIQAEPAHAVPTPVSMLENQDVVEELVDPSSYIIPWPVLDLLARNGGESDGAQAKKKGRASKKIHVDLMHLDSSIKQAEELKASSYRQNILYREMMLSIVALREKLSLHLMHHNKTTVQLRDFNSRRFNESMMSESTLSPEQRKLSLERFNHLSDSNTQAGVTIEQLLQDCQDIIGQSTLLSSAFKHHAEVVGGLQRDLLSSRLVTLNDERPGINGTLVSALKHANKKATLEFIGGDSGIDRKMLESLRDPLRHIVNNAIAHGIESPSERVKAGKREQGKITIKAERRGRSLLISLSDDGRGIDPEAIRQKAIATGKLDSERKLTDEEVLYLITEEGFSMSSKVDQLSGRGVGMDIVRNKVEAIGGHLTISSELGKGTTFVLDLPSTMGSNRALVCRISDQWFAIPTSNMTQVMDYPTDQLTLIKSKPGTPTIVFEDNQYDLVHLADLIAVPDLKQMPNDQQKVTPVVLIEQGGVRLAVEVEQGVSMPEIHVTKFEGILGGVRGIVGSTDIHDGTPALVIDAIELARLNLTKSETGYSPKLYRVRRTKTEDKPLVLVVEDAASFRRMLTDHFERLGWEVVTARDGKDALDKLPTLKKVNLFVVDVEMPRMDGLTLTGELRSQSKLDHIPIIMLTTRANVEAKAKELGVNVFLSKPYNPVMLNQAINEVCAPVKQKEAHA